MIVVRGKAVGGEERGEGRSGGRGGAWRDTEGKRDRRTRSRGLSVKFARRQSKPATDLKASNGNRLNQPLI